MFLRLPLSAKMLIGALFCLLSAPVFAAYTMSAYVVSVSDGDSLQIVDSSKKHQKVRVAFIDAPELSQTHGQTAKAALSRLVHHKTVQLLVIDKDKYGRKVAQVFLNNQDVGLLQVAKGHAWHYRQLARKKQTPAQFYQYTAAEKLARARHLGLWIQARPREPWRYRHSHAH